MFFGRASSRSTWRWLSRSSAASSIVTIRSVSGIAVDSAFSSVVLPEPVPPEMRMLSSARMQRCEEVDRLGAQRPELDHVVQVEPLLAELADRDERARQRERRDHGVDAAAVGKARVDHRRRLVDPPADLRDDLVDDATQVRLVGEADGRLVEASLALDPDVERAVDHDLGDAVVGQEPLERAVAEDVVGDLGGEPLAVVSRAIPGSAPSCAVMSAVTRSRSAVRVDVRVEELRAELADDGEVDPVLDLGERIRTA